MQPSAAPARPVPWPAAAVLGGFLVLVALALWRDLFYFSDGAWFAFAIATGSGWDLFWSDWPRRLGALFLVGGPAWLVQAAGGSPWLVGKVYQAGFYAAPLVALGLLLWLLPPALRPRWLKWFVLSFVTLGLGTFGFGTEAWIALPLLWPVLAAVVHPPRGALRQVAALAAGAVFLFSHELAMLTAPALALALAQSWRSHAGDAAARGFLRRFIACALVAAVLWTALVIGFRPRNPMIAQAMVNNPKTILDLGFLLRPMIFFTSLLAVAGMLAWWRPQFLERRSARAGIVLLLVGAVLICSWADLPSDRYFQRTAIVWLLPVLALAAVLLRGEPDWKALAWVVAPALALQLFVQGNNLLRWNAYRTLLLAPQPAPATVPVENWAVHVLRTIPASKGFLWDWTPPYVSIMLALPAEAPPILVQSGGWYAPMTCRQARTVLPGVAWLAPATRATLVGDVCAKNP